jgi:site-specific recombinase XerD
MKPTDFAKCLTEFLGKYLPHERGVSPNTIAAYRDTFVLLITYLQTVKIKVEKLTLDLITRERIAGFLDWLEKERNCSVATRNARLAAIHSFFSYMQHCHPETLFESQQILSMKMKKYNRPTMSYLSIDGIKLLLKQPEVTTSAGRRDLALLSLMYDTGCRVQEIVDLTPNKVRLSKPATICIKGKGNKTRIVPMLDEQVKLLENYMKERKLLESHAGTYPLFYNNKREKLTRAGINYILLKYAAAATKKDANALPEKISPHSLRHSKAMHLLQAGVNLVYIRDILGHVSITTTEIYARADSRQKREALEKAYTNVAPVEVPSWLANDNLLEWLKSF